MESTRSIAICTLPMNSAQDEHVRLSQRWHARVYACANPCGPTRGYGLQASVEPDTFRPMHRMIAKEGAFPATKAVKSHGYGNWDVNTHHPSLDTSREIARCIAVTRKQRCAITVFVLVYELSAVSKLLTRTTPSTGPKISS